MVVVVELGLLAFVVVRVTVGAIAGSAFSAPQVVFRSPFNVVSDYQIEVAVFIIIEPASAR